METTLNKPVTARSAKDKLIVALDFETAREAFTLFSALRDVVGMFKVGSQLFTAEGPGIVRDIVRTGGRVFLDLKFHDIPNTVAAAGVEATRLGVSIFNVHACGGSEMMRRTSAAVAEMADREGIARPLVIGVTVLTSADDSTLEEGGFSKGTNDQIKRMSRLAADSGLDGVVASPSDVELVREAVAHPDFVIVTPGVRPVGVANYDQRRVMTPSAAVRAGADYLVVGRAILGAPDPAAAALRIIEEMQEALG
ncbi:MAG: orotidine-5-phosphate decarboxylase [Acidobacteriota bacterium]|jgi:orotidine-5'-phosphate decarboxylase|nr:orotidine-5-phosphate decarboxylase [Acidobacteriota bacterium]